MRLINDQELLLVSGAGQELADTNDMEEAGDPEQRKDEIRVRFKSDGDQRNQFQKDLDERYKDFSKACKFLQFGCQDLLSAEKSKLDAENYAICKAEGGEDGPDGCGVNPRNRK